MGSWLCAHSPAFRLQPIHVQASQQSGLAFLSVGACRTERVISLPFSFLPAGYGARLGVALALALALALPPAR